eukprot:TRINITY_DN1583_c0_g1_i2.p1 TRINITY_DN1583_c0_g1~~TRINITY_DN1583_c0_g1_i2.p1  ORF type:complete len:572 (+),score=188.51 TRINITY_DN1583_c0_g1_i2:717-2432(+)
MMGVGTASNSMVHVTDMDVIEKSNLSRQFLFRPKDVEQLKSTTAANAVKHMNPHINIKSYSNRVGAETETIFNSEFYNSLSGVCNALDNVEARLYMDSQCIFYKKPLLESGTLGTKGNTQIIVPNMTESYGSSRDPPEKSIPICTLHHFPNNIEHTIQWARDCFEGIFHNAPETVNGYLTNANFLDALHKQQGSGIKIETLTTIKKSTLEERPKDFSDCVKWARLRFEEFFNNNIQQLLYNFPLDMITSTGAPFWSGPKRAPTPLTFNPQDPNHVEFVVAAANLRAFNYNIPGDRNADNALKTLEGFHVPPFEPKKGVKINTDENAKDADKKQPEPETDDDEETIKKLSSELPNPSSIPPLKVSEFEKDDDTNFHIDFITAAANLRANNYSIPNCDKHKCKGIAGKIIPAMVTTTAVVSGLVCIEMLKIHQGRPIEEMKNGFLNLALPFCSFAEPIAPAKTKIRDDWSWTLWDRFDVEGEMTLKQFMDYFKDKHNLEVTMISSGVAVIYAFFFGKDKLNERLNKPLSEVVSMVTKTEIPPSKKHLTFEICVNRIEDDEEVDVPYVKYVFRK